MKKQYLKAATFLKGHLAQVQIVLIILVSIVAVIFSISNWYEPLIISLLLFVGSEFFILSIGYLENIQNFLKQVMKTQDKTSMVSYSTENIDWDKERISNAKHTIFISGIASNSVHVIANRLLRLNENVILRCLTVNPKSTNTLMEVRKIFGKNCTDERLKHLFGVGEGTLDDLKEREATIIKHLDLLPTVAFIAVDIDNYTENTFIQAKHYFVTADFEDHYTEKHLICTVSPGHQLFDIYKEQIKVLWAKGVLVWPPDSNSIKD